MARTFVRIVALVAGLQSIFFGAWALVAPENFYDTIATFPPYNEHFLHDVGAFQLGLGAVLLLALRFRDALYVALAGFGVAEVLHTVAHIVDSDLGGRTSNTVVLGIIAVAVIVAAVLETRSARSG